MNQIEVSHAFEKIVAGPCALLFVMNEGAAVAFAVFLQ